jgi:hypothetical protein
MEPPEERLEAGLTWPRFRSAYAAVRRGASGEEVSRAWSRYKALHVEGTRTPARRSSPRRSPRVVLLEEVVLVDAALRGVHLDV